MLQNGFFVLIIGITSMSHTLVRKMAISCDSLPTVATVLLQSKVKLKRGYYDTGYISVHGRNRFNHYCFLLFL